MLTAKGYELPREELCRQYQLTAILPKPFSPRELVQTVERILEQHPCTPMAAAPC
jgi:hypothetical protein